MQCAPRLVRFRDEGEDEKSACRSLLVPHGSSFASRPCTEAARSVRSDAASEPNADPPSSPCDGAFPRLGGSHGPAPTGGKSHGTTSQQVHGRSQFSNFKLEIGANRHVLSKRLHGEDAPGKLKIHHFP